MEKLSVYEDYLQSMAFLHASKNRLLNAVETSRLNKADGKYITETCQSIYRTHAQRGCERIDALSQAVLDKNISNVQQAMQAVHKHNRQTMRISKVFEEDVCDVHPDPDAPIDENAPKVPADFSNPLPSSKMRAKLQTLLAT